LNGPGLKKAVLTFLVIAAMAALAAFACGGLERVPPDQLKPPPMPEQQRRETPTPVGGPTSTTTDSSG
jgi:hypothetical protein